MTRRVNQCLTCRFRDPDDASCHRYPPTPVILDVTPGIGRVDVQTARARSPVQEGEWCGEWRGIEPEKRGHRRGA